MMEAGTGVTHSEFNASDKDPVHFLQIWVIPKFSGLKPSYQQHHFSNEEKRGNFRLVISTDGKDDSLRIHQDMAMYSALISGDEALEWSQDPSRLAYVHVALGALHVNGMALKAGDGIRIAKESHLKFDHGRDAEVLLFDLPVT
jgi:redox-sensitive bicupin YhaK (pirin superfamily)